MKPRIPYTKPSITDLEVRYATDAAANAARNDTQYDARRRQRDTLLRLIAEAPVMQTESEK